MSNNYKFVITDKLPDIDTLNELTLYCIDLRGYVKEPRLSFQYKGEKYYTNKETLNEVYKLIFNGEYDALELLLEVSDEIQKL